jgi:cytochrome c553
MECHRYNASGELAFGSPPLYGLQSWYLTAQLTKFKTGHRGTVKGDVNGAKMVFTSSFIENDQMLKDLVGYILSLNPIPENDPFTPLTPAKPNPP